MSLCPERQNHVRVTRTWPRLKKNPRARFIFLQNHAKKILMLSLFLQNAIHSDAAFIAQYREKLLKRRNELDVQVRDVRAAVSLTKYILGGKVEVQAKELRKLDEEMDRVIRPMREEVAALEGEVRSQRFLLQEQTERISAQKRQLDVRVFGPG